MQLEAKIAQLESSLRRYGSIPTSQVSSLVDKGGSGANNSLQGLFSADGSRHTNTNTTGDEVWRGPKNAVQPTRTFSDDSTKSSKPDRLPSIAENAPLSSRRRHESSEHSTSDHHKPSIDGAEIDKDLDGISFKTSGLTSSIAPKSIMTPQSPSPESISPSKVSPGTMPLPSNTLSVAEDPYTKDAGHTPLARRTYFNVDGASSPGSGDATTPTQLEQERPLEPQPSRVTAPSERSDSYFPTVPEETSRDEDTELKGQLGLTNDDSKDKAFFNELDSKLIVAARQKTFEPDAVAGAADHEVGEGDGDKGRDEEEVFEQPEAEPQLRIKRSMNFGSAFGSKNCGKGI